MNYLVTPFIGTHFDQPCSGEHGSGQVCPSFGGSRSRCTSGGRPPPWRGWVYRLGPEALLLKGNANGAQGIIGAPGCTCAMILRLGPPKKGRGAPKGAVPPGSNPPCWGWVYHLGLEAPPLFFGAAERICAMALPLTHLKKPCATLVRFVRWSTNTSYLQTIWLYIYIYIYIWFMIWYIYDLFSIAIYSLYTLWFGCVLWPRGCVLFNAKSFLKKGWYFMKHNQIRLCANNKWQYWKPFNHIYQPLCSGRIWHKFNF